MPAVVSPTGMILHEAGAFFATQMRLFRVGGGGGGGGKRRTRPKVSDVSALLPSLLPEASASEGQQKPTKPAQEISSHGRAASLKGNGSVPPGNELSAEARCSVGKVHLAVGGYK